MLPGIVGFDALGRHGALGVVVGVDDRSAHGPVLIVRGGISDSLVYHVPWTSVRTVSSAGRNVVLDLDLADFDAHLREDGTVELRLAQNE